MTIVVENSTDQVEAYTKGNGVFPIPAEVKADNEAQAAKKEGASGKQVSNVDPKSAQEVPKAVEGATKEAAKEETDDVEGDDGLTPRQKREFTKSMLATIAKKHRKQMEAEEFAATQFNEKQLANQRATKLEADIAALRSQVKPEAKEESAVPDRAKFDTDQAYWDAMVDYRVDQKLRANLLESTKREDEQRHQEVIARAKAKIERAIELVPDFKEVTEAADISVPPYVVTYMKESDLFAELGYHFATHPDVLAKLTKFTAGLREGSQEFVKAITRQLVEVGKIESTLQPFASTKEAKGQEENATTASQTDGTKPSTETGSAPSKPRVAPIIRPLNGGSATQVAKDESEMTSSEATVAWQKKHGVNLTARKRH